MIKELPRLMIAGTGSDCGKTTVTCALIQAIMLRNKTVHSFKCGPDYIDPMFHSKVIGVESRNLDLFLCSDNTIKNLLAHDSINCDVSIIEGVMGMYDGIGFSSDEFSANHISRVTSTDEIIVVNPKGQSVSLLAELQGFLNFNENRLKGVILNKCSKGMYNTYKKMIEEHTSLKVYGYLPKISEAEIGSRHLGLITAMEIEDIKERMLLLGRTALETLDIEGILELAMKSDNLIYEEITINKLVNNPVRIAVAYDKAFCFYYEDNLRLLRNLGAEFIYFSPMMDKKLPENINGIIIGGGYPELYAEILSENREIMAEIKCAANNGMPVWAECGGFMYLGKSIEIDKRVYEMVGLVPSDFSMTDHLVRFGYQSLIATRDNILCKKGDKINCHEFHHSDSNYNGNTFIGKKLSGKEWESIISDNNIFAGYPHLHLWSNIEFAKNFIRACSGEK